MGQKWAQFMVNLPFNMHLKPEEEKKIYTVTLQQKKKKKDLLKRNI